METGREAKGYRPVHDKKKKKRPGMRPAHSAAKLCDTTDDSNHSCVPVKQGMCMTPCKIHSEEKEAVTESPA